MIILGIDPGLASCGYGLIKKTRRGLNFLECGLIKTPAETELEKRLWLINRDLKKILTQYQPQEASVEDIFFFHNQKTALKISQVHGVIMLALKQRKIPIYWYTPLQIKQALTGYGRASKKEIQKKVISLLKLKEVPRPDDVADALATALCHAQVN